MMSRRSRTLLAPLTAAWLAACAPTASYWTPAQSSKQNQVEAVRLMHDLQVPASGSLSAAEIAGLDGFLARHQVGYGDDVTVIAAANRNHAPLTEYLHKQGIDAHPIAANGIDVPTGGLRLLVERYVVIPPNCPDWSKPSRTDYGNTPMSNMGCANATNLGLMLADPRDLLQGRQPGAADGTASAAAVQRYRTDKVKSLDKGVTTQ
jgi:pilus assembly protein CpaD